MKKSTRYFYLIAVVALVAACGGVEDDPILRLSADESLTEGRQLMEQGKYGRARDYLIHAFEVEPNSASGREALLLVADAYFKQGGPQNLIKAEAKYRDFQNRFPTSDLSGYVQFQVASSLAARTLGPDRDQTATRQALEAYEDVIRLFPTSDYAESARGELENLRLKLAESEFLKGHFNFRRRLYKAAIARFEYLLKEFPSYPEPDKVLYFLARSYEKAERLEEHAATSQRLRDEFPDSDYVTRLDKNGARK